MKRKVTKITKSNLNELRNELGHHLVSLTLSMEQEYLKRMPAYSEKMEGFRTLQSFAGTLPADFDYKKELEEMREEKYSRFI